MRVTENFISFEGIEGSGKSTQAELLADYFREKGFNVVRTAEPGGTRLGDEIRRLLLEPLNSMDPLTELLLYYASRAQHVKEVINPALMNNAIVITDRFSDSTLAYQGYARGIGQEIVFRLDEIVTPDLKPVLTFLLDLDVEEGLRRNRKAQKEDRFELETIEFHRRVREAFLNIAKRDPGRVKVIDASRDVEEIKREIIGVVKDIWH